MGPIINFLEKTRDAVRQSYQFEYAGIDKATGKDRKTGLNRVDIFADGVSPLLLFRASFFLELKDAYERLYPRERKLIDLYVKNFSGQTGQKTFSDFIDFIVGGPDGSGACLQSATSRLAELHEQMLIGLEDIFEDNSIKDKLTVSTNSDDYRDLPQFDIIASYLQVKAVNNAVNEFFKNYTKLLTAESKFGQSIFRKTYVQKDWGLREILEHAMQSNNRSRRVCVTLGWLDKEGKIPNSAPQIIKKQFTPEEKGEKFGPKF
jgi:hypothetical protein